MINRLALALAVPLLCVLAACAPAPAPGSADSPPLPAAPLPVDTAEPAPPTVADYLVEYEPADPVSESSEIFHYAFWAAEDRAVHCNVWVGGQTDPYADCFVMREAENRVTYPVPVEDCGATAERQHDGFEVSLMAIPANSGWDLPRAYVSGCELYRVYPSPEITAATLVLPNGSALDMGPFRCSVLDEVATCAYAETSSSISIGLSALSVAN